MPPVLKRILAFATLGCYLVVGAVALRFMFPEYSTIEITTDYFSLLSDTKLAQTLPEKVADQNLAFSPIQFPESVKVATKTPKVIRPKKIRVAGNELPFLETIHLAPVKFGYELPTKLISLYKDLTIQEAIAAAPPLPVVEDKVSTTQAKDEEQDPEFFEYPDKMTKEMKVASASEKKIETAEELKALQAPETPIPVSEEVALDDLVAFDYSPKATKAPATTAPVGPTNPTLATGAPMTSQPLPTFNSQAALNNVANHTIPTVSHVTTQNKPKQQEDAKPKNKTKSLLPSFPSSLTIQAVATDLKSTNEARNFEIRFQDDPKAANEDYGNGSVTLTESLGQPRMTRAITLLKKGFVPTDAEVVVEEGEASLSIPLIDEETFHHESEAFEQGGPVGALLIELDDATEYAKIDVPYGKDYTLDGNLVPTTSPDYRYQLLFGVRAGNVLVTYKTKSGEYVSKVAHVHENELTFEANYFEPHKNQTVKLFEEDLLSKEANPLIISADQVHLFASSTPSRKINNNTYQIQADKNLLGARTYFELSHQQEPLFIGVRARNRVMVPSENFMRHILSNAQGELGQRCLIQVNLARKVASVDVGAESVGESLMTNVQYLDRDGKFYDSPSTKTRKVIILGENHANESTSTDGKINLKITNLDGTTEFIGTYCSPNTYLVEQL